MVGVIGDIHGCLHTLRVLYKNVKEKYGDITIYSTGDLVDRGNFSLEVIDFCLDHDIKFVLGNHESMFYHSYLLPSHYLAQMWIMNENAETLKSYAGKEDTLIRHVEILTTTPLFYNTEDCFISHAGIAKRYESDLHPVSEFDEGKWLSVLKENMNEVDGVLWNRNPLLNIGKLQVVGHTRALATYFDLIGNSVYIDTSAFSGHMLTCVIVEDSGVQEFISIPTNDLDLSEKYLKK